MIEVDKISISIEQYRDLVKSMLCFGLESLVSKVIEIGRYAEFNEMLGQHSSNSLYTISIAWDKEGYHHNILTSTFVDYIGQEFFPEI